jgi:hypothetical protein
VLWRARDKYTGRLRANVNQELVLGIQRNRVVDCGCDTSADGRRQR